ncbi:hypothetical protein BDV98DRAFT_610115 [Pterulicium gracile]|uniref:DNA polymerase n=1 Tax=Pterulicium gracile TaxID=1884261 RepID=A0A5C3R5Y6_9AGAR|nr:hypothetical protein BDV98DRAFT_610115 [Pterula gracilis]
MEERACSFRVSINSIDHALVPSGPLDRCKLALVPIIRIFGDSSLGQKVCTIVHQVYPYFFIEYLGNLDPSSVNEYIHRLTISLNYALAVALKRDPLSPKAQFVRAILLVKGVPFYGFHTSYQPFLKILISQPSAFSRAVTIMQSGMLMRTAFRVHESHLSYILQFMSDFGLYGCGWTDGSEYEEQDIGTINVVGTGPNPTTTTFHRSPHPKQASSNLEIDVVSHQILNRYKLSARDVRHKPQNYSSPQDAEPSVPSVRELWDDERSRRRKQGLDPSPNMPQDPSENSRGGGPRWAGEAEFWEQLHARVAGDAPNLVLDEDPSLREIMTTFESVQALWAHPWRSWRYQRDGQLPTGEDGAEEIIVNVQEEPPITKEDSLADLDVDLTFMNSQQLLSFVDEEVHHDISILQTHEQQAEEQEEPADNDQVFPWEEFAPLTEEKLQEASFDDEEENPFLDKALDDATRESDIALDLDHNMTVSSDYIKPAELYLPESNTTYGYEHSMESAPGHNLEADGVTKPLASRSSHVNGGLTAIWRTPVKPITLSSHRLFAYSFEAPTTTELLHSIQQYDIPARLYTGPHYSNEEDWSRQTNEVAGVIFTIPSGSGLRTLEPWQGDLDLTEVGEAIGLDVDRVRPEILSGWEYASLPPSFRQVKQWSGFNSYEAKSKANVEGWSQIKGPTVANSYGMKKSPLISKIKSEKKSQHMSVLSLELFALKQEVKNLDSDSDEIAAVFISYDDGQVQDNETWDVQFTAPTASACAVQLGHPRTETASSELDMLNQIVDLVLHFDPDVIIGWEVEGGSWGYLHGRGLHYGMDIAELIGRGPMLKPRSGHFDQWSYRKTSTFKVVGRHVLNLWRVMRTELTLSIYSFENVVFNALGRRFPRYTANTLTTWFRSGNVYYMVQLFQHFIRRTSLNIEILEATEVLSKTAEFARVFGVDFFSVLSRGSQYKVESFMARIAKPESFVLLSPSKEDVGKQNAAECIPLIMEPFSSFYTSPVLVLDFQSLYPSVMIAYNYCYSTCVGRVQDFHGRWKFGVSELDLPNGLLGSLASDVTMAPNGMLYVKTGVRRGLLGRMLTELLDTRVMVKQSMKTHKHDKMLQRILDARQLGLKYIANVTYGYTSASFSGRMPAVEIADSIVQTGREILEAQAIDSIHATEAWGAQVVYGDTDSLFVHLPGKTKAQAFHIGNEIAAFITLQNKAPIKLKFEKVYHPCVLMAKKRYVGFKYESPLDLDPVFDAKGIETVRRDGVPAQQKMTEACLKILFRTANLSEVKTYCWSSWMKILQGRASLQDFIFAKEVRLGTYSDKGAPPPGAAVAAKRLAADPQDHIHYAERIPYVVALDVNNPRILDRVLSPHEVLENPDKQLDSEYYITRVLIPPLQRIFTLVGADVRAWYEEMPRITADLDIPMSPSKRKQVEAASQMLQRIDLTEYMDDSKCITCGEEECEHAICDDCREDPLSTLAALTMRLRTGERRLMTSQAICTNCTGARLGEPIECVSLDCPWMYERSNAWKDIDVLANMGELADAIQEYHEVRGTGSGPGFQEEEEPKVARQPSFSQVWTFEEEEEVSSSQESIFDST